MDRVEEIPAHDIQQIKGTERWIASSLSGVFELKYCFIIVRSIRLTGDPSSANSSSWYYIMSLSCHSGFSGIFPTAFRKGS